MDGIETVYLLKSAHKYHCTIRITILIYVNCFFLQIFFDVEHIISGIDPILWDTITLLTQSVSERRGTSTVLKEGSNAR